MVRLLLKRQRLAGRARLMPSQSDEGKRGRGEEKRAKKRLQERPRAPLVSTARTGRELGRAWLADLTIPVSRAVLRASTGFLAQPFDGITGSYF